VQYRQIAWFRDERGGNNWQMDEVMEELGAVRAELEAARVAMSETEERLLQALTSSTLFNTAPSHEADRKHNKEATEEYVADVSVMTAELHAQVLVAALCCCALLPPCVGMPIVISGPKYTHQISGYRHMQRWSPYDKVLS